MIPTRLLLSRTALVAALGGLSADAGPLRVLRSTPADGAPPASVITVAFDRPVAGSLDRTVDPRSLITVAPAVPGVADWRDPVTLRFRPAGPLAPNTAYTVTVSDRFQAMDGARLAQPFTFSFRVRGPRVLAGWPTGPGANPRYLTPASRFALVLDVTPDRAELERAAYLEFDKLCSSPGVVRLRMDSMRAVSDSDRWEFREAGGWERDRAVDRLRRVVTLAAERPLPPGCEGHLVMPTSLDDQGRAQLQRWSLATYGAFRLVRSGCGWDRSSCPTGPLVAHFTTPVTGAEVLRHVTLKPATPFTVRDTGATSDRWALEAVLKPRTWYAIVADSALRDVFDQRLTGNPVATATTTGYAPAINYASGRALVERVGLRTFGVSYVNVDTLEVLLAAVPDSLEPKFLARSEWSWPELWPALSASATRRKIKVTAARDQVRLYGIPLPPPAGPHRPTLLAVQVTSGQLDSLSRARRPIAVIQVTDLAVHARVGLADGVVWVTSAADGKPRRGAAVTLYDAAGRAVARSTTDDEGLARFTDCGTGRRAGRGGGRGRERLRWLRRLRRRRARRRPRRRGDQSIRSRPEPLAIQRLVRLGQPAAAGRRGRLHRAGDLSPGRAALRQGHCTYRAPGQPPRARRPLTRCGGCFAIAKARAPAESSRKRSWVPRPSVRRISPFGYRPRQRFGSYNVAVQFLRDGRWTDVASTSYRVAEYRPPEFLVDVSTDSVARFGRDSLRAAVEARYLFGAPMGRAAVSWVLRQQEDAGPPPIPQTDGFYLGDTGWWWEEEDSDRRPVQVTASGSDTLDPSGRLALRLPLAEPAKGRPALATFEATVKDVNRQTVSASASIVVHPAAFYLGVKPDARGYFWTAGTPVDLSVIAVRPDGKRETGIAVAGTVVRREWHQTHRQRQGYGEIVGEWVSDTVARCTLTTAQEPVQCRFTPPGGGSYIVTVHARDAAGREAVSSFTRWVTGKDWVPWNDETQFKMDVIPDRTRYSVGDTATVLFASPFTDADAWVTVEREGLIEQRRLHLTSGSPTLKFPITEAFSPNVYVSIVVARGRSAKPGPADDPGRPTIRVGYAELRVTPERKRLTVDVAPEHPEYRPGDTASVRVTVRDAAGTAHKSEVTLWAVDEGVLALTGYPTPDPLDLVYRERGLGLRLASNLVSVVPQVAEGEKGKRAPGGGGGLDAADVLRSRFQTTAFFLGSIVTGADGTALARARLPDNLTTFRLMAVAVTAGDRYGKGQSSLLVTRPLVARPALPRFLRGGDRFSAGVVVNRRSGVGTEAKVTGAASGVDLLGAKERSTTLEAGRGREVRFDFRGLPGDSATFRFTARSGADADGVQRALPVRPAYHPRSYTVAGVLRDTATAELRLPDGIDPARSTLALNLGTSPIALIRGAERWLRVYPYWCSEQVSSEAQPLIALYRAARALGVDSLAGPRVRAQLEEIVATLSRRQRPDGGIGIWSSSDWTTPWLSSYAGQVLLEAKDAGIPVNDSVLARLGGYLRASLTEKTLPVTPVALWYDTTAARLSERVLAVDWLSRAGLRDRPAENELLRMAAQLYWEDRIKLASVLARDGDVRAARRLLEPAWASVKVEGRTATLPAASRRSWYFYSLARPAAYLLSATLAVEPSHPLVGPLVETLIRQGQGAEASWTWNTQDYGTAISALTDFWVRQRAAAARGVLVRAGGQPVLTLRAGPLGGGDSTVSLARLPRGSTLRLSLETREPGEPVYYYLTLQEVPKLAPVNPDEGGIQVERWYERPDDGKPTVSATEGELVRVRLRITAPAERRFVLLDDALPAGLEAVDLSLRTVGGVPGPGAADSTVTESPEDTPPGDDTPFRWAFGSWDAGWWSPFDHRELRDDRVVYFATVLWPGSYTATYLARATTPGVFIRPPAHAEEMYNPAVFGRSDGGVFTVKSK